MKGKEARIHVMKQRYCAETSSHTALRAKYDALWNHPNKQQWKGKNSLHLIILLSKTLPENCEKEMQFVKKYGSTFHIHALWDCGAWSINNSVFKHLTNKAAAMGGHGCWPCRSSWAGNGAGLWQGHSHSTTTSLAPRLPPYPLKSCFAFYGKKGQTSWIPPSRRSPRWVLEFLHSLGLQIWATHKSLPKGDEGTDQKEQNFNISQKYSVSFLILHRKEAQK